MSEKITEAKQLEARQAPWVDLKKWHAFLRDNGVSWKKLEMDNYSDGLRHEELHTNYSTFCFQANYWNWASGWQEAIDWVISNIEGESEK